MNTCWGLLGSRRIEPINVPWAARIEIRLWDRHQVKTAAELFKDKLTAIEIDEEWSVQMFVPNEDGVNARAWSMIDLKVTGFFITAEKVKPLLVDHQFLLKDTSKSPKLALQVAKHQLNHLPESSFPLSSRPNGAHSVVFPPFKHHKRHQLTTSWPIA